MSETFIYACGYCGHASTHRPEFYVVHPLSGLKCKSTGACERRQKRNKINTEIATKASRPVMHPVDRFTRLTVALCGIFMGAVLAIGVSYLWLGI
jgi:hypothetical protein